MKKLSSKQQEKLKEAINTILDSCEGGTPGNPNALIAKTAQAMHLSKDYLPMLVRAYNTGVQGVIRAGGSTIAEKTASFPLASVSAIEKILYPPVKEKKAGYDDSIDDFFSYSAKTHFSENDWKSWKQYSIPKEKRASYQHETEKDSQLSATIVEKTNTLRAQARMVKTSASESYMQASGLVGDSMKKYMAPCTSTFIKFAEASFGQLGKVIAEDVIKRYGITNKKGQSTNTDFSTSGELYTRLAKAAECHRDYTDAAQLEQKIAKYCVQVLAPMAKKQFTDTHGNIDSPEFLLNQGESYWKAKEASSNPFPAPLLSPGTRAVYVNPVLPGSSQDELSALAEPDYATLSPFSYNVMRAMDDTSHESGMRDIKIESLLTDLCNTDEYLAKQDPELVLEAFNDIMEIAPRFHTSRVLLRAALRQYIETGGLDIPTLGVYADIDKKMNSEEKENKLVSRKEQSDRAAASTSRAQQIAMEDAKARAQREMAEIDKAYRTISNKEDRAASSALSAKDRETKKEMAADARIAQNSLLKDKQDYDRGVLKQKKKDELARIKWETDMSLFNSALREQSALYNTADGRAYNIYKSRLPELVKDAPLFADVQLTPPEMQYDFS